MLGDHALRIFGFVPQIDLEGGVNGLKIPQHIFGCTLNSFSHIFARA